MWSILNFQNLFIRIDNSFVLKILNAKYGWLILYMVNHPCALFCNPPQLYLYLLSCLQAILGLISDQEFWYKKYKIYEFSHNFSQNIIEEWFIWQSDLSVRSKRNRRTNHQPKLPRAIIEKAIKSFVGPHTLENSLKLALYGPILRRNFYSQVNISHCSHSTLLYLKLVTRQTDKIIN